MNATSPSTLANLAEIIGAGSIITGLLFGWFQIRHIRMQQRNAVAINLMQTFTTRNWPRPSHFFSPSRMASALKNCGLKETSTYGRRSR